MIPKKYLIVYDISQDKYRKKIQKELEKFGSRWQYSTYYCEMDNKQLNTVKEKLKDFMEKTDSIITIPLNDNLIEKIDFIGKFQFRIKQGEINVF